MAVYQDKAKERIKKSLRRFDGVIERALRDGYKEADTRKIVSDVLATLGWDKYRNITAEQMINSKFADYVVKTDEEELFVVEVKQIGLKLKEAHLQQAKQYAFDEGIDWVVLTNGDVWEVYRCYIDGKVTKARQVFSVKISDKETKPAVKTDLLYLLSEEAFRKKELDAYYERFIALSGANILDHLLSDDLINKLRVSINKSNKQRFTNFEVAEALISEIVDPALIKDEHIKRLNKIKRAGK